ncbi:CAAX protease self-immunity [Brevibacterium sandarakinum]|uniref:CAAX protease self-immunity n=1 Tax=Brevibacterium sandarakinum TaxID=629680 RepID=A0A1H1XBI5_BRESA|nr:response regulator [Brevibacterium sandarakinum]SDT06401.1 CAAX protease self-immunity [Brevibacterium sandarakinum]
MITIALADDDPLFTAGLAMVLDAHEGLQVLWEAVDGADALRQHRDTQPDVLLLDIQMPGTDGLTAIRQLISDGTGARIIILTTFESDEYVLTAIEAGAAGFLLKNTPLRHAGSMVGLALLIPWSMLIQRWLYGVPGASLHSVTSWFRFDVLGKALLVFGPAWLVVNALGFFAPAEEVPWSQTDLIAMFLVTVLLTPLQTSGEEYGFRGLVFRIIGSWTRSSLAGLVAGVVVTSVLFTAMHGSTDPYIITWYLTLFTCLSIITWRTGGLEIAVVLHAILNTFSFIAAFYLRIDFGAAIQDRSAGVGTPYQLLPALAVIVITAVIWWWTRKTGPALTPVSTTRLRAR